MAQKDEAEIAYHTDIHLGLSADEVAARVKLGQVNTDTNVRSKSEKQIILENTFTFFNLLNFALALLVLLVGSYKNMMFMGVIFSNIAIGSIQGIRAKRTIDKLSLISAPKATVIRDGQTSTVPVDALVLDDLTLLQLGQQVCADAVLCTGELEVNESLLTGESDSVLKRPGDTLLSGSFVVSGSGKAQVIHVGQDNYASRIVNGARHIKKANSEILHSLDYLVKTISILLLPIGILLFCKDYFLLHETLQESVVGTVAALIGMIPEGLVLLTSVVFAVSVIRLSRHKALVQNLYCTESLARMDVLCLDKTGTITEGSMQVDDMICMNGHTEAEVRQALQMLIGALSDNNPTYNAIQAYVGADTTQPPTQRVPFSSARKWSGATFADGTTYIMGAGEFILQERYEAIRPLEQQHATHGERVILLVRGTGGFDDNKTPPQALQPMAMLLISDPIRKEAPDTLRFFAEQGVNIKIISGDNPLTVSKIAQKAGLQNAHLYCDASTLQTDDQLHEALQTYTVFGRVTPQQKLQFVQTLQADGHIVGMTGDGVNDVLALKEADCSVAMAAGSDAARTVSDLVLLDSNFSSMPRVVREGRRSINNLQRSASLFLQKTIYASLMALLFIFLPLSYPFEPIQLTFISALTIGVPSFILALEPNTDLIHGNFLPNVLRRAISPGLTMVLGVICLCVLQIFLPVPDEILSTMAVLTAFAVGFLLLFRLCLPMNPLRCALFFCMVAGAIAGYCFLPTLFSLTPLQGETLYVLLPLLAALYAVNLLTDRFLDGLITRHANRFLAEQVLRHSKKQNRKTDNP